MMFLFLLSMLLMTLSILPTFCSQYEAGTYAKAKSHRRLVILSYTGIKSIYNAISLLLHRPYRFA